MRPAEKQPGLFLFVSLAVILLPVAGFAAAPADKAECRKLQTQAWSLFYKGKLADAHNVLLPLTKSVHEDVRMEAFHCMARVFWKEGSERGKMEANKIWNKIEEKSTVMPAVMIRDFSG